MSEQLFKRGAKEKSRNNGKIIKTRAFNGRKSFKSHYEKKKCKST